MKKIFKALTLIIASLFLMTACEGGNSGAKDAESKAPATEEKKETTEASKEDKKEDKEAEEDDKDKDGDKKDGELTPIKVASHTSPMTDILEAIKPELEKDGYELELVPVSDNVQANVALNDKEVDANFFQHKLFMEMFNKGNNGTLVAVQPVYNALVSFYGKDLDKIEDIPEGGTVAIPEDPTNMTRALRLLATTDLITLKDPDSYEVTVDDIKENPKNLQLKEIGLLNLNEAYNECDLIFNYPAYSEKIDLLPEKDGLVLEKDGGDETFAIYLCAREDNENDDKVQAMKKALTSDTVKDFVEKNLKGHANLAF